MGNVIDIEKFKNAFADIGAQFQQTVEKVVEPTEEEPKRKPIAPPAGTQQEEADSETTVEMEDFWNTSAAQYDEFDKLAWKKGDGYSAPNFPIFTQKLEGLESGLYMFAGESNMGKTAIAVNIMWDICTNPDNKLFGIYFSLDDSAQEAIPRIIAMDQHIPISVASKPQRYQNLIDSCEEGSEIYSEYLDRRTAGLAHLKELSSHFKVEDGTKITCAEQMLDYCIKAQNYVKGIDPDYNIIVCIDSLSDITFANKRFASEKERNDHIAKQVKKWAVEILNVPIIGTLHLRKIEQNRRPTVADVKESGLYVYEASVLFLVHNDVSRNKQAAAIYNVSEDNEKMPVIELDWAKNKKSAFKGRTYHNFIPNYSLVTESSEERMTYWNALVYQG